MQQLSNGTLWQTRLFSSRHNRIVLLAILVISLVLGVASKEALATSHNEPVNGCYDTNSRGLRYVDTGTCRNNEVALSWPSMSDFIALQVALADEATQRETADAALAQQIADEAAQREAADAALQAENDALLQQIAGLQAAIDAEAAARQAGDTTLQAALDDEIAARNAGDILTLANANAYTDEKFNSSIEHTNTEVAKEADARGGGRSM
ncbi:MAG: hypothetical protein H0V47_12745 [Chloroflexia bacterium]|nr:hypothetical protein [Chloroflexia bacterium]